MDATEGDLPRSLRRFLHNLLPERRFRQKFADRCQKLARSEGLGEICVAAGLLRLDVFTTERIGSHDDDRDMAKCGRRFDNACRLVTLRRKSLMPTRSS